jgi:hypothetical protein
MPTRRTLAVLLLLLVLGGVTWSSAQQGRSSSLTAQDYIDIQQLYAAYNNAFDGGRAEAYAQLFTPDGTFNDLTGHDALVAFVTRQRGSTQRHWNSNLTITGTPEGASGSVYLLLVDVAARPPALVTAASYQDTLVKTADGWRFKKRHVTGP